MQRNIAAFGGDPNKVTIFGESAGASSIDRLVTTFPDNPPFHAAITQSGQASTSYTNSPNGTAAWESLVAGLNCTSSESPLACVRAASAVTIKDIIERQALSFSPVTDNVTQLADPKGARAQGNIARVPLLTGTNAQEGTIFTLGYSNLSVALDTFFPASPDLRAQIASTYAVGSPGINTQAEVLSKIATELVFQCVSLLSISRDFSNLHIQPSAVTANATADSGLTTYRYYLNASFPNYQPFPGAGAFHGAEIPLIFGTYPRENATQQETVLSLDMQTAWASFAKDPELGPGWMKIGEQENDVAVLGGPGASGGAEVVPQGRLDGRCALFEGVYASVTSPAF